MAPFFVVPFLPFHKLSVKRQVSYNPLWEDERKNS